eukprot:m.307835 g.307835  ORF g.307835 m.307835 type:complete len:1127 (+) comp15937_c1_seq6:374-3754(+)
MAAPPFTSLWHWFELDQRALFIFRVMLGLFLLYDVAMRILTSGGVSWMASAERDPAAAGHLTLGDYHDYTQLQQLFVVLVRRSANLANFLFLVHAVGAVSLIMHGGLASKLLLFVTTAMLHVIQPLVELQADLWLGQLLFATLFLSLRMDRVDVAQNMNKGAAQETSHCLYMFRYPSDGNTIVYYTHYLLAHILPFIRMCSVGAEHFLNYLHGVVAHKALGAASRPAAQHIAPATFGPEPNLFAMSVELLVHVPWIVLLLSGHRSAPARVFTTLSAIAASIAHASLYTCPTQQFLSVVMSLPFLPSPILDKLADHFACFEDYVWQGPTMLCPRDIHRNWTADPAHVRDQSPAPCRLLRSRVSGASLPSPSQFPCAEMQQQARQRPVLHHRDSNTSLYSTTSSESPSRIKRFARAHSTEKKRKTSHHGRNRSAAKHDRLKKATSQTKDDMGFVASTTTSTAAVAATTSATTSASDAPVTSRLTRASVDLLLGTQAPLVSATRTPTDDFLEKHDAGSRRPSLFPAAAHCDRHVTGKQCKHAKHPATAVARSLHLLHQDNCPSPQTHPRTEGQSLLNAAEALKALAGNFQNGLYARPQPFLQHEQQQLPSVLSPIGSPSPSPRARKRGGLGTAYQSISDSPVVSPGYDELEFNETFTSESPSNEWNEDVSAAGAASQTPVQQQMRQRRRNGREGYFVNQSPFVATTAMHHHRTASQVFVAEPANRHMPVLSPEPQRRSAPSRSVQSAPTPLFGATRRPSFPFSSSRANGSPRPDTPGAAMSSPMPSSPSPLHKVTVQSLSMQMVDILLRPRGMSDSSTTQMRSRLKRHMLGFVVFFAILAIHANVLPRTVADVINCDPASDLTHFPNHNSITLATLVLPFDTNKVAMLQEQHQQQLVALQNQRGDKNVSVEVVLPYASSAFQSNFIHIPYLYSQVPSKRLVTGIYSPAKPQGCASVPYANRTGNLCVDVMYALFTDQFHPRLPPSPDCTGESPSNCAWHGGRYLSQSRLLSERYRQALHHIGQYTEPHQKKVLQTMATHHWCYQMQQIWTRLYSPGAAPDSQHLSEHDARTREYLQNASWETAYVVVEQYEYKVTPSPTSNVMLFTSSSPKDLFTFAVQCPPYTLSSSP